MHACSSAVQVGAVHTHVHTNLTQHNGLVVTTHGTADVCEAAKADDLDDAVSDVYLRPSTSKRTPIGTLSTKSTTTSTTTTSAASWKQRTGIRLWASEPFRAVLSSVVPLGRTCTLVIGTDHAAILCGPALLRGHRARALATYTPRSRKCNNGIRCAGRKTLDDADLG